MKLAVVFARFVMQTRCMKNHPLNISEDIQPLSDFKRRTPEHVRRLGSSRRPVVLTVNGRPKLVVQDAQAYQDLLDQLRRMETEIARLAVAAGTR